MKLKLITPPAEEPVNLAEAKAQLRIDSTNEDAVLLGYLKTAREDAETILRRAILTQTWDIFLKAFPGAASIRLPLPPLQSVTGVYYTPDGGTEQTYASTNYIVDIYDEPGKIVLKSTASWPGDDLQPVNGVRVRFVAGWAGASLVPERIRTWILLTCGLYYENRELASEFRTRPVMLPHVDSMLEDLRMRIF